MTISPAVLWVVAAAAMLVAAVPVTSERLTRFTTLTGLSVTTAGARRIIDHFAALRRWRLVSLALAVPLACLTDDPFYLVVGWCAVSVLRDVRSPSRAPHLHGDMRIYREAWLLGLGGAVVAGAHQLLDRGATPAWLAHAAVVVAVAVAVPLAARNPAAGPAPDTTDDTALDTADDTANDTTDGTARAEHAVRRWSTRALYLGGTAIVLSGALLTPGQPLRRELPEYSVPRPFPEHTAMFTTVEDYKGPTCPWFDQLDDPCRHWLVNGEPFPQAAPYVVRKGGAPGRAPFTARPDDKAVVYLDRRSRRMMYQDAGGVRPLTGRLADTEVPTATFAGQNRYVALTGEGGTRITDTETWRTVPVPGVQKVHDLNRSGIVATTATRVLVLDHRGRTRMSLPLKKTSQDAVEDTYHLRPDGGRVVVIRQDEGRVETYDPETGERMASVMPEFPGDDVVDVGLGWSKQGRFLLRGYESERVYSLDLMTGELLRRGK
ncbi:hypothetical protein Ppa06_46230 [Planomonospora parontospora subsp. parontospora]|uniref:Uncharacterized protein n=2 Tax=Planomonospora parontospora TaxID=58119 RepID=A0AA37BKW0_9ACTN|nr:hypothetical protein [Planomonospora parontospora]GGK86589.1 hypothetical protein GCM10010126_52300 [Planomonospora parontospora]GII10825.1 hypothetical protein Ppa06_46230 [Planomonospora parontospora subsp. parontospora]